jgi:hypothetical protein
MIEASPVATLSGMRLLWFVDDGIGAARAFAILRAALG